MKRLLQALVMLALSSSCLLAQLTQDQLNDPNYLIAGSLTADTNSIGTYHLKAGSVTAGTNSFGPLSPVNNNIIGCSVLYPIGTADNHVTVNEYIKFLNDQYPTGKKTLTVTLSYLESWEPAKYAAQYAAQYAAKYAKQSDPGYDVTLMQGGNLGPICIPSTVIYSLDSLGHKFISDEEFEIVSNNNQGINWNYSYLYSWKVNPKNSKQIDYTFSYSYSYYPVEERGDWIIDSVLSEDMANSFNEWRASQPPAN